MRIVLIDPVLSGEEWKSDRTKERPEIRLNGQDRFNDDHQSALSVKRPTPI
jgi:hypothetical protein